MKTTTMILVHLVDRGAIRFDADPSTHLGDNELPVARISMPPGRLFPSPDGRHRLVMPEGTSFDAAQVFAGDCPKASVELLLTLSPRFVAISGWERKPGDPLFMGPCPKCWKRNDTRTMSGETTCRHCGIRLSIYWHRD